MTNPSSVLRLHIRPMQATIIAAVAAEVTHGGRLAAHPMRECCIRAREGLLFHVPLRGETPRSQSDPDGVFTWMALL